MHTNSLFIGPFQSHEVGTWLSVEQLMIIIIRMEVVCFRTFSFTGGPKIGFWLETAKVVRGLLKLEHIAGYPHTS